MRKKAEDTKRGRARRELEDKAKEKEAEAEEFKETWKLADGTARYKHPRDFVDAITCPKVSIGKGQEIHKVNCCLGRCEDCPASMEIPDVMTGKGPDARTISFQVHECHSFCTSHFCLWKELPLCAKSAGKFKKMTRK